MDLLERLDRNLEPSTKLCFGAVLFGAVKGYPKRQSDGRSEQFDDDGQNDPIVSPDVTWSRPAGVIPEGTGAENMLAPFWAECIVDGDKKLFQLKGLDDQKQKSFEESFVPELEMGEEAVKARFVTVESRAVTQSTDVTLAGLNHPGNRGCTKIRPTPFGKSQTKIEDYLGKFRCIPVVDHGPSLRMCEMSSQHSTSEDGLFFLSVSSFVNP